MDDGLRMVQTRACGVWVLPNDPTCAGVARRLFRRVASELSLDREAIDDGVTMVSELAANTLHASQRQLRPVNSELWLYLRGVGPQAELVGKIFDTLPGWARGNVPGRTVSRAPADAMSGRGLEVVHELSDGRWGHHLSRSRLSGAGVGGKAVWFALPAPVAGDHGPRPRPASAADAMNRLENDLGARGFTGRMVRADDQAADMAVLSIANGLTVWCRASAAWLRAPGVAAQQWSSATWSRWASRPSPRTSMLAATAATPSPRPARPGPGPVSPGRRQPGVGAEHGRPEAVDVDRGRDQGVAARPPR